MAQVECLGDLQGPKFRVGELAGDPIELVNGEVLEFGISKDDNDNIRPGRITMKPTTEQNALIAASKVGIDLLLEDGIMKVNVVEKLSDTELKVKVIRGGKLKARKGVNVPDVEIDCAALTTKDVEDAEFLLQLDPPIEYICVSFVQKGQDLQELIDIMDRLNIPQAPAKSFVSPHASSMLSDLRRSDPRSARRLRNLRLLCCIRCLSAAACWPDAVVFARLSPTSMASSPSLRP